MGKTIGEREDICVCVTQQSYPPETNTTLQINYEGKCESLGPVRLLATPWTADRQAPPSMGFSRQECWSGLSCPSPGDLPDPGIKPRSPQLQAESLSPEPQEKPTMLQRKRKNKGNYKQNNFLIF